MDAVEFLKEGHRMCDSFDGCDGCPGAAGACFINDIIWCKKPEDVVAAVEKFVAENSKTTRQAQFLLAYPEGVLDVDGLLCIMPCQISKQARDAKINGYCNSDCRDCRRRYWLAEIKGAED